MRLRKLLATSALLVLATISAHADALVDIVVTGDGHTATFSVPAVYTLPNPGGHPFTPDLPTYTTGTVDGVPGNPLYAAFYFDTVTGRGGGGVQIDFTSAVSEFSNLDLRGGQAIQYLAGTSPTLYILDYVPGTYNWVQAAGDATGPAAFTPFTVTITPEATTPEPATWAFVATGLFGIAALCVYRRHCQLA